MAANNIAKLIQEIARKGIILKDAVIGTAENVRPDEGLCDVIPQNEDAKITDVKLRVQQNKAEGTVTDFLVMAPVEGSQVIVNFLSPGQGFVSMYSEVKSLKFILSDGNVILDINETADTIQASSGDISFKLDDTVIELNGSNNDGITRVNDVVSKLNNLENDINNLKSIFGSWVPVPNDGGAALKSLLASYVSGTLTPTVKTDLENTKVKHGE